jgi:hypothetical protein
MADAMPTTLSAAAPVLNGAARFFAWWGGELAALIPAPWRGPPPVQHLMSGGIFTLDLQLPQAAQRNLQHALRYQLMAQSPVPVDACIYDSRIIARDKTQGSIEVRVVMTTLERLAKLNDQLRSEGQSPQLIGASVGGETYVFQRARRSAAHGGTRTRLWLGLSVALLLSLVPLVKLGADFLSARSDAQLRSLQTRAAPQLRQRAAGQALARHGPLLQQRMNEPALLPLLAALQTAHGPKDWTELVSLSANTLRVALHSDDPQALRARLQAAPNLSTWQWRIVPPADPTAASAPIMIEATR